MNRFSCWLMPSLVLNALLLLAVGWRWQPRVAGRWMALEHGSRTTAERGSGIQGSGNPTDSTAAPGGAVPAFAWSQLNVHDWPMYRDGLRRIGCPEFKVHEILEPLVYRNYADKVRDLTMPMANRYWEFVSGKSDKGMKQLTEAVGALAEKEKEALKSLFGSADAPTPPPSADDDDPRLGFLPASLREEVAAAQVRHQERLQEFSKTAPPDMPKRDAAVRAMQQELDQELAGLLSPEQWAEYQRRNSEHAGLRSVEGVTLSEKELAEIIRLKEENKLSPPELSRELSGLLGPSRFAELERAQQPGYQELLRLSQRLDASPETAVLLWEEQQRVERQAKSMVDDTAMAAGDRAAKLSELKEALQARAAQILGARGQSAWMSQQKGWLQNTFSAPPEDPLAGLGGKP